jgi:hypothetical protein
LHGLESLFSKSSQAVAIRESGKLVAKAVRKPISAAHFERFNGA